MDIKRIFTHLFYPGWWLRRDFPPAELAKIEATIKKSEATHSGEIRFAIESALPLRALWNNETPTERAIEVFSLLRVWDTEDNNGVLIYLLLADRKVEITTDRAINKVVDSQEWQRICQFIENDFKKGNFSEGIAKGIEEISTLLNNHFPISPQDINELSDRPVIL